MDQNSDSLSFLEKLRPLMMGLTSIVLCFSLFFAMFTPYPLGVASLQYGRKKAFLIILASCILCFLFARVFLQDWVLYIVYVLNVLIAYGIIETFHKKINPVRGIFYIGTIIVGMTFISSSIYLQSQNSTATEFITAILVENQSELDNMKKNLQAKGSTDTFQFENLLSEPKSFATLLVKQVPGYFVGSLFVIIWLNMFMLLNSSRFFNYQSGKCNIKNLLEFKVPEYFIWAVITLLIGLVFGDKVNEWIPVVSVTILRGVGVFYFFQGFGIYIEFLNTINLKGFFRTLLIVMTILTAGEILAIIGLFDMFIDFRKLIRNKFNRGE